jgi:hypothetical protein
MMVGVIVGVVGVVVLASLAAWFRYYPKSHKIHSSNDTADESSETSKQEVQELENFSHELANKVVNKALSTLIELSLIPEPSIPDDFSISFASDDDNESLPSVDINDDDSLFSYVVPSDLAASEVDDVIPSDMEDISPQPSDDTASIVLSTMSAMSESLGKTVSLPSVISAFSQSSTEDVELNDHASSHSSEGPDNTGYIRDYHAGDDPEAGISDSSSEDEDERRRTILGSHAAVLSGAMRPAVKPPSRFSNFLMFWKKAPEGSLTRQSVRIVPGDLNA